MPIREQNRIPPSSSESLKVAGTCDVCGQVYQGHPNRHAMCEGKAVAAPQAEVPVCFIRNCPTHRPLSPAPEVQQARCAAFVHGPEMGIDGCDFAAEGNVECAPGQCAARNLDEGQQGESVSPGRVAEIAARVKGDVADAVRETKEMSARLDARSEARAGQQGKAKVSDPGKTPLSERDQAGIDWCRQNPNVDALFGADFIVRLADRIAALESELAEAKQYENAARAEVERLRAKLAEADADNLSACRDANAREAAMRAAAAKEARDRGAEYTAQAIERLPLSTGAQTDAIKAAVTRWGFVPVALEDVHQMLAECATYSRYAQMHYQAMDRLMKRVEWYRRRSRTWKQKAKAAVTAERERCLAWLEEPLDWGETAEKIDSGDPAPGTVSLTAESCDLVRRLTASAGNETDRG